MPGGNRMLRLRNPSPIKYEDHASNVVYNKDGIIDVFQEKIKNVSDPIDPLDAVNKSYVDSFRKVGDLKWSAQQVDTTDGWLICNGRSLLRSTYADLFAILGTSFGSVDSTHFNLPDCRGRIPATIGAGPGLTARSLGETVGSETHQIAQNELPSFNLSGTTGSAGGFSSSTTGSAGSHTHTINDPQHSHSSNSTSTQGLAYSDGSNTAVETDATSNELNLWTNPVQLAINSASTGITVNSVSDHTHTIPGQSPHTHTMSLSYNSANNAIDKFAPTVFLGNIFIYSNVKQLA